MSLPGRIAISKTFLIAQVNYLGAVSTPTAVQADRIQRLINEFVLGGTPVAKDRLYVSTKNGGLGLIDCWRVALVEKDTFSCELVYNREFAAPALRDIAASWHKFFVEFWKVNDNYVNAPLFNNPVFIRGRLDRVRVDTGLVDSALIGGISLTVNYTAWRHIIFSTCVRDNRILDYEELKAATAINFNFLVYLGLRRALHHAILSRSGARKTDGSCITLINFLKLKAKGSKRFRRILEANGNIVKGTNITAKFCELIDIPLIPPENGGKLLGLWNTSYLPVESRYFIFQFFNNALATGDRLANRYKDTGQIINESCSFCRAAKCGVPERETFAHVFLHCTYIFAIVNRFCEKYLDGPVTNQIIRSLFFTGTKQDGKIDTPSLIVSWLFFAEIWNAKKCGKIPSLTTIEYNINTQFNIIVDCSKKFSRLVANSSITWCRNWRTARGAHGRHGRG